MLKKIIILTGLSLSLFKYSQSQDFRRAIFMPGIVSAYQIIQDGEDFVILGNTTDAANNTQYAYTLKVSQAGEIIYLKKFGECPIGPQKIFLSDICRTDDGNYFVVGSENFSNKGKFNAYIAKIDPDFNTVWTKSIPSEKNETGIVLKHIINKGFGNYVITGRPANNKQSQEIIVMKADQNANIIQTQKFNDEKSYQRMANPEKSPSLMRLNDDLENMPFASNSSNKPSVIFNQKDEQFSSSRGLVSNDRGIFVNTTKKISDNHYIQYLLKFNSNYDTVFMKPLQETRGSKLVSCGLTGNNDYLYAINTFNYTENNQEEKHGYSKIQCNKVDTNGNFLTKITLEDNTGNLHAKNIIMTADGGAMILGYYEDQGNPYARQLYLIKITPDNNSFSESAGLTNSTNFPENNLLKVYPNPSEGLYNLNWSNKSVVGERWKISLYNSTGAQVYYKEYADFELKQLDIRSFAKGPYVYVVQTSNNKYLTGNLVKQ